MEEGRGGEHNQCRRGLGVASMDQRLVQVSDTPPVNWEIPERPELGQITRIPPVMIEVSEISINNPGLDHENSAMIIYIGW